MSPQMPWQPLMTDEMPRHLPHFTIAVPLRSTPLERIKGTVESILGQTALACGQATVSVRVVVSELGSEERQWLASHSERGVKVEDDIGRGLYPAIAQALEGAEGDYFGYLGGGDAFEPTAFALVMDALPRVGTTVQRGWVTGMIRGRREDGAIVRSLLPFRYRPVFWKYGLHGTILPTIQQESTLWTRDLNDAVEWGRMSSFQLAGDYYLWKTFAAIAEPVVLEAAIGSFRWHGDNMSADWDAYVHELQGVSERPPLLIKTWARLERLLWALPPKAKSKLSPQVRRFEWPEGPWK
jgi:hypothetical protein